MLSWSDHCMSSIATMSGARCAIRSNISRIAVNALLLISSGSIRDVMLLICFAITSTRRKMGKVCTSGASCVGRSIAASTAGMCSILRTSASTTLSNAL
jgi:hypothetical protein